MTVVKATNPHSECNREIRASRPGATYDGACKDMHPLKALWTATAILASRSARTSWFAGRAMRASARYKGARTGQVDHIPQDQAQWVGRPYRASSAQRRADVRRLRCRRPRLMDNPHRCSLVREAHAGEHWSSKEIAGRIAMQRPDPCRKRR